MTAEKMSPVDLSNIAPLVFAKGLKTGQFALKKAPTERELTAFTEQLKSRYPAPNEVYVNLTYAEKQELSILGHLPLLTFHILNYFMKTND